MACTLKEIKRRGINKVNSIIKGNANTVSFDKRGDAIITPNSNSKSVKTMDSAREMAKKRIEKINKWSKKTFKTDAYKGQWATMTESPSFIRIEAKFPPSLLTRYENKINEDQARQIQQEDAERIGEDYSDDYLFDYLPQSQDGYNYGLYLEKKEQMRDYFSTRISVLENMANKTKDTFQQISEFKEVVKKLNKDVKHLQNEDTVLSNFFNYFNNDLNIIRNILLNNPTMDNLLSARMLIEELEFIKKFETDNRDIEGNPTTFSDVDVKTLTGENYNLFKQFEENYTDISARLDVAEKLFLEQGLDNEKLTDDSKERAEEISWFAKNFLPIDGSSDASPIMKYVRKTHDDAIAKAETYTLRSEIKNIEKNTKAEMKKNNHTFDIFKRKTSEKNNRLIGKFNNEWTSLKSGISSRLATIQELNYKRNKDSEDYEQIRTQREKLFDLLNGEVEFIDVTRIPELQTNPELSASFGNFFQMQSEGFKYKEELIQLLTGTSGNRESAEREYQKIVDEQLEKLFAFEVDMERNLKRLLKEESVQDFQSLSNKSKNQYLANYYTNSPFAFAESYRTTGNSSVAKIYFTEDGQQTGIDMATLEYQSVLPKNEKYFDQEFESTIANNEQYFEAWKKLNTSLKYINKNRKYKSRYGEKIVEDALLHEQDLYKQNVDSILSMVKHYAKSTIDRIKYSISTSQFKDKNNTTLGSGIISIDEMINNKLSTKKKVLRNLGLKMNEVVTKTSLTPKQKEYIESITDLPIPESFLVEDFIYDIAKNEVLKSQNDDLFESISSQLEVVEKFKAKKEIESKLLFLKNLIQNKSKETNNSEKNKNVAMVKDFINANLYNINNRANWGIGANRVFRQNKDAGSQIFMYAEKETIEEIDKAISLIKEMSNTLSDEALDNAQADIEALEKYKKSKGRIVSPGTIVETITIKIPILAGLGLNLPSQIGNLFMGNLSGRQNDGLEWSDGNFIIADSYTRKWKIARRKLSSNQKKNYKLTNTLIDGLGVFQNSANEVHKVIESDFKNRALKYVTNPLHIVGDMEKNIQRPQILAKLGDIEITDKNGNKVFAFNINDTNDPHPAFELNNGVLKLKEEFDTDENRATWINRNSQEYADIFGESGLIPKMIARINGDYRDSTNMAIKNTSLGAMFMMFKTWMPAFIQKRYGRKDGVINGLYNSDRGGEAFTVQAMTTAGYFGIGSMIVFSPLFGIFMTAGYMGYRKHQQIMKEDGEYLDNLIDEIKQTKIKLGYAVKPVRIAAGVGAKLAQQSTNLLFGKQIISNSAVSSIAGMKQKENESDSEFELNKARLNFLLTEASTTATLLMLKILANALLFPDEEEEKKYKELDGFYEKVIEAPETASYYFLENMLTRFGDDTNLLNDPASMSNVLKLGVAEKLTGLAQAGFYQASEGDYTRGKNKGRNRIWVKGTEFFLPRGLSDISLGFGKTTEEDYRKKDNVNRPFMSDLDKVETERQKQRSERKLELEQQLNNQYPNKSKDYINKKVQKKLKKEFPTIKKYFDKKGEVLPWKKNKVERYK